MESNSGQYKERLRDLISGGFNPIQYEDIAKELGVTLSSAASILWTHRADIIEWEKQYERRLRQA